MKQIILFSFLLLLIPFAYAEDIIVRTDIKVNAVSWIENNESRMNITVFTNNSEGDKNLIINNVHEIYDKEFIIRLIYDLDCGNTTLGQIDSYFKDCDGKDCKTAYLECKTSKETVVNTKQEGDALLAECNSEKNSIEGNSTDYKNKFESSKSELGICSTEKQDLKDDLKYKIHLGWIGGVLVLILIFRNKIANWYINSNYYIEKKGRKSEEEKKSGFDYKKDKNLDEKYRSM